MELRRSRFAAIVSTSNHCTSVFSATSCPCSPAAHQHRAKQSSFPHRPLHRMRTGTRHAAAAAGSLFALFSLHRPRHSPSHLSQATDFNGATSRANPCRLQPPPPVRTSSSPSYVVILMFFFFFAVGAAIERCCSSGGSGGLWQEETMRLHSRLQLQQVTSSSPCNHRHPPFPHTCAGRARGRQGRLAAHASPSAMPREQRAALLCLPLCKVRLQMQQDRSNAMAMQLLRGKTASAPSAPSSSSSAADLSELQSVRQQLSQSQATVLELQLEQVFATSIPPLSPSNTSAASLEVSTSAANGAAAGAPPAPPIPTTLMPFPLNWSQVARCSVTDLTVRLEQVLLVLLLLLLLLPLFTLLTFHAIASPPHSSAQSRLAAERMSFRVTFQVAATRALEFVCNRVHPNRHVSHVASIMSTHHVTGPQDEQAAALRSRCASLQVTPPCTSSRRFSYPACSTPCRRTRTLSTRCRFDVLLSSFFHHCVHTTSHSRAGAHDADVVVTISSAPRPPPSVLPSRHCCICLAPEAVAVGCCQASFSRIIVVSRNRVVASGRRDHACTCSTTR
jgi:hypothetical protein